MKIRRPKIIGSWPIDMDTLYERFTIISGC